MLKFSLVALFLSLMQVWLSDQGYDFGDFWDRAFGHQAFSRTDYFAIIAHYLFLQVTWCLPCPTDRPTDQQRTLGQTSPMSSDAEIFALTTFSILDSNWT